MAPASCTPRGAVPLVEWVGGRRRGWRRVRARCRVVSSFPGQTVALTLGSSWEQNVNRKELIAAVAGKARVAEADTDKVLAAFQDVVFDVVADGQDKLSLPGFLTFEQGARAAREGRNPATGETIQIAAAKTMKVTAGSKLKAAAAG